MPVAGTASAAGAAHRNGIYAGSAGHADGRVYIFISGAAETVAMAIMRWESEGILTAAANWTVVVDARAAKVAVMGGMPRVSSGDGEQWSVFRLMKFGCESDDDNEYDDDDDGKTQIQLSAGRMVIGLSKAQEA